MSILKYKDENNQWQSIVPQTPQPEVEHTSEEKYALIVSLMNKKAQLIGMTNTTFNNPFGGAIYSGFNSSTARDLLKLGIFVCGYPQIVQYLSFRGTRQIPVYGSHARTYTLTSDSQQHFADAYKTLHNDSTIVFPYKILGYKGGGWSSPAAQRSYCAVVNALVENEYVSVVISRVSGDSGGYTGRQHRAMAVGEILDICAAEIRNSRLNPGETPETVPSSLTHAEYGCAAYLPVPPFPETWANFTPAYLFEQGADTQFNPASTTKIMSAIIFIDSGMNLLDYHSLDEKDCVPDSATDFNEQPGDILCNDDGMYLDLILSNGPNVLGLCRHAAERIFKSADSFGIQI